MRKGARASPRWKDRPILCVGGIAAGSSAAIPGIVQGLVELDVSEGAVAAATSRAGVIRSRSRGVAAVEEEHDRSPLAFTFFGGTATFRTPIGGGRLRVWFASSSPPWPWVSCFAKYF